MTGREAALRALGALRKSGAWSESYLKTLTDSGHLEPRDAALAYRICLGVIQNRTMLRYLIDRDSRIKLAKMEPVVGDVLLLSAYQLFYMDRIPARAAVSEGVSLCRSAGYPNAAGLVNAILRRLAAMNGVLPETGLAGAERLSVEYSHPRWLVDAYIARLGEAGCEALLRSTNGTCGTDAQVNTLKTDAEGLLAALKKDGAEAERHPWLPDCVTLSDPGDVARLEGFRKGFFFVQDAAARLAVTAAGLEKGMTVVDGCAAPGGKSFAAALDLGNSGRILACDLHEKKLPLIDEGAARLGISVIETLPADGRKHIPQFDSRADAVLADVPCSGLGVIRKKPEIRWKDPEALRALPEIQLDILRNLARYVKPGGVLVYSTCTVLERENEAVVRAFLPDSGFEPEDCALPGGLRTENGMLTLWPHIHGTDGFFICRLRRRKDRV